MNLPNQKNRGIDMCVDEKIVSSVGSRFKLLRQAAGWTASQVAEELGVSRQTIVNIETKKTPFSKMQCLAFLNILNERSKTVRDLEDILKALIVA